MPDRVREVVGQLAVPECCHDVPCSHDPGRPSRRVALVVAASLEADGERGRRLARLRSGSAQDRRRVQAAAEEAPQGNVGVQAEANGFQEEAAHFVGLLGEHGRVAGFLPIDFPLGGVAPAGGRAQRPRPVAGGPRSGARPDAGRGPRRRGQVPPALDPDARVRGRQEVSRRKLGHSGKEGAPLVGARVKRLVGRVQVPRCRNARREEGLCFRRQVERAPVLAVEERLEAEAVPGGEEDAGAFVPDGKGELAAKVVQALASGVFVQVQGDFRVGAGAEAVPGGPKAPALAPEVVELAVGGDEQASVLAGDGLRALGVVDRQAGVAEARAA